VPAPNAAAARDLVSRFRGRRLVVLGDLMLDRYLWGRVERISPEAPVPVVSIDRESFSLGGAATVAHNLASLGAAPRLVGPIGDDANGRLIADDLSGRGVDVRGLIIDPTRRTTVKTRVIAHQQHVVRTDEEDGHDVAGAAAEALEAALDGALEGAEGVIVSDYGKGAITAGTLARLLALARDRRIPVSVDPKETHFFSYTGAAVLTPNVHEAGRSFGRTIRDEPTLLAAGWGLREKLDAEALLISRGAEGMSLFERGGRLTHLPTVAREVFDVTGAGDTVVSVYALALAGGAEPPLAAFLANHAAGLVIRHAGTAVTTADELLTSLAAEPLAPAGA
jgi:D-beta-D-heptose 7-phosphate kinase/D-beta-D-heptose 1-phosphate adenosyltransferase